MRYKDKYLYDDFDVILAIKWCWDRGIYFYPVVIPNQAISSKFIPKVRIELKVGGKIVTGKEEYSQKEELYDKIRELYMHKYNKRKL